MNNKIDYEKIDKINKGIDICIKNMNRISKYLQTHTNQFTPSDHNAGFKEEYQYWFNLYQENLKELEKCFETIKKEP